MTTATKKFATLREPIDNDPERRRRVEKEREEATREQLEYSLAELRKTREMTQVEIARRLTMNQPGVSRIENHEGDTFVSTVREYVEALGGRLELTAVFDGERIPLAI